MHRIRGFGNDMPYKFMFLHYITFPLYMNFKLKIAIKFITLTHSEYGGVIELAIPATEADDDESFVGRLLRVNLIKWSQMSVRLSVHKTFLRFQ